MLSKSADQVCPCLSYVALSENGLPQKQSAGVVIIIELDDGKIYRKALYLMVKTMVSCRFSLKPIQ